MDQQDYHSTASRVLGVDHACGTQLMPVWWAAVMTQLYFWTLDTVCLLAGHRHTHVVNGLVCWDEPQNFLLVCQVMILTRNSKL